MDGAFGTNSFGVWGQVQDEIKKGAEKAKKGMDKMKKE